MQLRPNWFFGLALVVAAPGGAWAQQAATATTGAPSTTKPAQRLNTTLRRGIPRTLTEALAVTYSYNPALLAERARLRATDENVPQAVSGWRPTIVVASTAGYGDGSAQERIGSTSLKFRTNRNIATGQATLTQPLYTGGKVEASVQRAKDTVFAERATLISTESTQLANAVNAYVGVIQARQTYQLDKNNEEVLREQLKATQDRFRVGELTRTDVAQAEAALAGAVSTSLTAQGTVNTSEATYVQVIGFVPPPDLVEPQPLQVPARSADEAGRFAEANNPSVISALFNLAAAKNAVDVAFAALLPQISLQGQLFQSNNASSPFSQSNGYQLLAQLSMPLYQGGAEYSAVRQARQTVEQDERTVADAKRTAVQNAVQAYQTLVAAREAAAASRVAIQANQIAVDGVMREALVGTATTLDVLIQQQNLLNSQVVLVQNLASLVTASYNLASAMGRLTARDLRLPVAFYDDTAYYNEVKNKLAGVAIPPDYTLYGHDNRK